MTRPKLRLSLVVLASALAFAPPFLSAVEAAPPVADNPDAREPQAAPATLLIHAKIHVGDGTVIDDGSVLIEDGKIAKVQPGTLGTADAPGATVVDLGGKTLTPGLIAADTALGLVEIGLEDSTHDEARQDESPIRASYDPGPAVNADSSLIAVQAIEGITTAAVAPRGGLISGSVAWIDLLPNDHRRVVAERSVAVVANGGRAVHGSRAATLAELRRAFEDAQWLRENERNFDRGAARELAGHPADLKALWPVLDKQVPLVVRADRASDLLALVELAGELGVELTILGAAEGWKVKEELAAAKVHVVVQPTHNLPGSLDGLGSRMDNAALLQAAGVTVALAVFDTHNVRNLTQEAGIAVANGLDANAALSAVTLNVAKAYGLDDDYGTIAVGKVASVVVWDGEDPFEFSTWAEQVYVRGEALDMRSRQTQLRERYRELDGFAP